MTEDRRVDMVRLPREERYFDREAILGRDAASVFPNLAKQEADAAGGLTSEAVLEALGARKFISETELDTLRATRGVTADDGAVSVDKPLAQILAERKAAKEAEHEDKWKQMKIGKNRPLDADELQFLDSVAAAEAAREREWAQLQEAELEAFKAAVRQRSAEPPDVLARAGSGGATAAAEPASKPVSAALRAAVRAPTAAAPKPLIKAVVKVKPKAAAGGGGGTASGPEAGVEARDGSVGADAEAQEGDRAAKRPKTEVEGQGAQGAAGQGGQKQQEGEAKQEAPAGLLGLVGAYGSESEDGEDG